jgi:hypothetical protein
VFGAARDGEERCREEGGYKKGMTVGGQGTRELLAYAQKKNGRSPRVKMRTKSEGHANVRALGVA